MRNLDLEHNFYYDDDLAQIYFDENFKHIKGNSWLYIDCENLDTNFNKAEFFIIDYDKTKKRDINRLKLELCNNSYIKDDTLEDLISEYLTYNDLDDLEFLLYEYNIFYKKAYTSITVMGYSQGDTSQVLTNLKEYKKVTGNTFNKTLHNQYFNNLFYNSPITGELTIRFDYIILHYTVLIIILILTLNM